MAANFKIVIQRHNNSLRFKLMGDFDGSSAFELINVLKEHHGKAAKVVINTDGISSIHPFGQGVFQKKCSINKLSRNLTFTGKHRETITPRKSNSL